jgi:NAD(P)H dehydrogenase (quinone)
MGITGQVGGEVGRSLLAASKPVRAIVRDASKGQEWVGRGCEIVAAEINDSSALAAAFEGAEGVFVLVPPYFDPLPGFPEARAVAASLTAAIEKARPERVVYLSTIGAQAEQENLLSQHTIIERALRAGNLPVTVLRPAWFMENSAWDIAAAREHGIVPSFLQPIDKPVPMVATADIGRVAAESLMDPPGNLVELEGPRRVTPNEIAGDFSELLGRPVKTEAVPHETWESIFRSQGMRNPAPRIRMLDGFNEGWIEFEGGERASRKGLVSFKTALQRMLGRSAN